MEKSTRALNILFITILFNCIVSSSQKSMSNEEITISELIEFKDFSPKCIDSYNIV